MDMGMNKMGPEEGRELELKVFVSHLKWVLRHEPWSSARAVRKPLASSFQLSCEYFK